MSYTNWLRQKVSKLEEEIAQSSVFERDAPATSEELAELHKKAVLHRYLKQQLLRREAVAPRAEDYDTQEFMIVRRA